MRRLESLRLLLATSLLAVFAAMACESDPDDVPLALTEECDACLSREACSVPWESCTADADCKQYVSCVLLADCYSKAPETGCEEKAGCALETDSEDSRRGSEDFEFCARTECADACAFLEP